MEVTRQITRVEQHAKKRSYYWIYLDGQEEAELSLHEDILIKYRLLKGSMIEPNEMKAIAAENSRYRAYASAVFYAGFKMRTSKEMTAYLKRKEFEEAEIRYAIERLQQERIIDDSDYARMFAAQRLRSSGKGRMLIRQELERRGIHKETAGSTVQGLSEDEERSAALKVAEKKWRSLKGEDRERRMKLTGFLLRRGFPGGLVRDIVRQVSESAAEELEEGAWLDN
ncbi:RecX family transcriptional regulator [Paenibacillus pasadenensis]|uniref:regulatory protein RecX n=1 Tax=Paenibacillus pasadenensis TaxID=217090 RepID=UPI0020426305|nr:RecX family transcriptional regulator [Paenibacillus pasadenensis]MCM3745937.1 RecX family transcriptional regulator [Paenibacillus pasadenensis]